MDRRPVLKGCNVSKTYKKGNRACCALKNVNFCLYPGEILGVVGESGSGKSTLLKMIAGLENVSGGKILMDDRNITDAGPGDVCHEMQMVFQEATASFDPKMRVADSIGESLSKLCGIRGREKKRARVRELMELVGMQEELADRYPAHLSGGQCQRMAIARAISARPKVLLCDEVTSALDVSAQAQIVELLAGLRRRLGISVIFVSHDLALVGSLCDRVMVLQNGECIEEGTTEDVIKSPKEEYTRLLLSSVLTVGTAAAV